MGLNLAQFKTRVVIPTLGMFGPKYSTPQAVNLVTGTCNKESGRLQWLVQLGGGPARGVGQMEAFTFADMMGRYLRNQQPQLLSIIYDIAGTTKPVADDMIANLALSVAMVRVRYMPVVGMLPDAGDARGLCEYWKRGYNTRDGAGVVDVETIAYFQEAIDAHGG